MLYEDNLIHVHVCIQTFITSLKQSGEHARTSLKVLQTLTYNCTDPDRLDQLATKLDTLITEFRSILPKTEGLILQPQARFSERKPKKSNTST